MSKKSNDEIVLQEFQSVTPDDVRRIPRDSPMYNIWQSRLNELWDGILEGKNVEYLRCPEAIHTPYTREMEILHNIDALTKAIDIMFVPDESVR